MAFVLGEHESVFELKPIGVNYTCELCGQGIMEAVTDEAITIELFDNGSPQMRLRSHKCNSCGGVMQLPKTYPYIAWLTKDEYDQAIVNQ